MLDTTVSFVKLLDREGKTYDYDERPGQSDVITLKFAGENCNSMVIRFFFDADGKSAAVRCFSICRFTEEQAELAIMESNKLNNEYRWVRFSVDSDNEVAASYDVILTPQNSGEVCYEILARMVNIIDKVYPRFMKIRWN